MAHVEWLSEQHVRMIILTSCTSLNHTACVPAHAIRLIKVKVPVKRTGPNDDVGYAEVPVQLPHRILEFLVAE